MRVRCDRCGRENPDNIAFCLDCGFRLAKPSAVVRRPEAPAIGADAWASAGAATMTCPSCGKANQAGFQFCVVCGRPLVPPAGGVMPPVVAGPPAPAAAPGPAPAAPLAPGSATATPLAPVTPARGAPAVAANGRPVTHDAPVAGRSSSAPVGSALMGSPVVDVDAASNGAAWPANRPSRADAGGRCPRCAALTNEREAFCNSCGFLLDAPRPAEGPPPSSTAPRPLPAVEPAPRPASSPSVPPPASQRAPSVNVAPASGAGGAFGARGRLVMVSSDGSEGESFALDESAVDIGGREGHVVLRDDPYVSPRHARLSFEQGRWHVIDLHSVNGVYRKLRAPMPLADGDLILLGQQVLRFDVVMEAEQGLRPATQHGVALFGTPPGARYARLCQRTVEGVTRDVYHVGRAELTLGREGTDVSFPDDPFLSRRHAVLRRDGAGRFVVDDLGSSNGTFVLVRGRTALDDGDTLRVGIHLFRLDVRGAATGGPAA